MAQSVLFCITQASYIRTSYSHIGTYTKVIFKTINFRHYYDDDYATLMCIISYVLQRTRK